MECKTALKLNDEGSFEHTINEYVKFTTPDVKFGAIELSGCGYDVYLARNDIRATRENNVILFSCRYEKDVERTEESLRNFAASFKDCELITLQEKT